MFRHELEARRGRQSLLGGWHMVGSWFLCTSDAAPSTVSALNDSIEALLLIASPCFPLAFRVDRSEPNSGESTSHYPLS